MSQEWGIGNKRIGNRENRINFRDSKIPELSWGRAIL